MTGFSMVFSTILSIYIIYITIQINWIPKIMWNWMGYPDYLPCSSKVVDYQKTLCPKVKRSTYCILHIFARIKKKCNSPKYKETIFNNTKHFIYLWLLTNFGKIGYEQQWWSPRIACLPIDIAKNPWDVLRILHPNHNDIFWKILSDVKLPFLNHNKKQ